MPGHAQNGGPIRFGAFEVDVAARELRKSGVRIRVQEQPFRVLAMLLARPGEVVTREELQQELWPGEEYGEFDLGLNTAVKKLRQALNDSADSPRWIETVPRVGYRFLGPTASDASPPLESPQELVRPRGRWVLPAGACALVIAGLVMGWFWGRSEREADARSYRLELSAPRGIAYMAFALSPDGSRLAFIGEGVGSPLLWIQSLIDGSAVAIEGTENAEPLGTPFWSPDGSRIGFFADRKLKRVTAAGGGVQTLCDAPFGRGGAWNADGVIVFAPETDSGLWKLDPATEECSPFITPDEKQAGASFRNPQFLHDGESLLFTRRRVRTADVVGASPRD